MPDKKKKGTKKLKEYYSTTGTKPSDWGIKDTSEIKSGFGTHWQVINNVNDEDKDQKRRARTG